MLIAERYRLEHEVGRGGMGAVWLAQDTVLGRPVALKRVGLLPGTEGADLDRVSREARVSAMLNNEHVVAVYDLVTQGDDHWLVMEYLASDNLGQVIKKRGTLSPDQTAGLLVQAARALAAAHSAGIVHRDVKPSNMLVTPEGRLKLGDFGIARAGNDPSLTQTGMVTGSPGYLSPEVAAGHGATAASDMWSFGATIFHAVTGQPPYDTSENLMGALYRIVHEEPVRTDRGGWLAPLLRATMHTEPGERWSAAQAIAFLRGGPGAALPAPIPMSTAGGTPTDEGSAANATTFLPATPAAQAQPDPDVGGPEASSPEASGPEAGDRAPVGSTASGKHASAAPQSGRGRRSRTPLWAVLGVLLVVALTYGAWWLGNSGDDGSKDAGSDSTRASQSTSPPSSPSPSSSSPTQEQTPTAEEMSTFAKDYIASAGSDPSSGYGNLTPEYQEQSGGYEGYSGFWDKVNSPRISNVSADPEAMTVSYDFDYTFQGQGPKHERVTLDLIYDDGTYLISGDG
ncbi:MAG: protein kinase [Nocardioides sp.]|nr:protein kinase [Nocardioides sp.]